MLGSQAALRFPSCDPSIRWGDDEGWSPVATPTLRKIGGMRNGLQS